MLFKDKTNVEMKTLFRRRNPAFYFDTRNLNSIYRAGGGGVVAFKWKENRHMYISYTRKMIDPIVTALETLSSAGYIIPKIRQSFKFPQQRAERPHYTVTNDYTFRNYIQNERARPRSRSVFYILHMRPGLCYAIAAGLTSAPFRR